MSISAHSSQTTMAIVPAQLGFLTIFNPSLGATDETIDEQIVYYASVNAQSKKRRYKSHGKPTVDLSQEERNERLRQIGLAQGMVEFSRGFANGEPVDTIETEKTRVVLQEIEPGWWILASIDLSQIPLPPRIGSPASGKTDKQPDNWEYSSRELKPSTLLMRDLLRAHSIFLLHHAPSLSALFVKSKRTNFVRLLGRYWDLFLSTWDVMLHGNPAANVFRGIKIAECGELGVGVGEEDRGSGEREVLEGFVDRVEGLTDLVVSKFGPSESTSEAESAKYGSSEQWLATGEEPGSEDGAIFLGVGALSRKSLRDITYWMEDLYTWGDNAYGVKDSPTSTRQARRRHKPDADTKDGNVVHRPAIDRTTTPASQGSSGGDASSQEPNRTESAASTQNEAGTNEGGTNKLMSYLKLGYGTHWTLGSSEDGTQTSTSTKQEAQTESSDRALPHRSDDHGHYLIGLLGDLDEPNAREGNTGQAENDPETSEYNSRILVRTLTVELDNANQVDAQQVKDLGSHNTELTLTTSGATDYMNPHSQFDSQDRNKTQKMRVVAYVNKPFVFVFLFQNRTDSLAWDGLYRSLHHQLAPLRKPLATSTTYRPAKPDVGETASHIFDLVWDPKAMTVHSTIPSIPTPADLLRENMAARVWSRAEAVNTHNQILSIYTATLNDDSELERTCKTNRGWWVVWTRILERDAPQTPEDETTEEPSPGTPTLRKSESRDSSNVSSERTNPSPNTRVGKEIFLVRRAGEHTGLRASYAENSGWADGASRLVQGIGVDTTKYIEGLLSLGR